ncbi:hypothetical protein GE061_016762 [Apolygus lucorum]|uniref:Uncharacterized protein n=1 Tax=Apolygus lucorum TaxID=248454 RepID=A0A8S9XJ72_APOLU|nr:hypothetical protein GE061_016762 [Apolygus lucorum]
MLTYKTIDALINEQITVSDDIIDKIQKISAVDVAESNLTMTIPKCTELSITCTSKTPLFNLDPKELLTHYTRTFLVPSMRNAVCIVLKEYLYDKEETGRFEFSVLVYAFTKGYLNNFMLHLVNDGAFDVILHYTNNKALPLDFKSVLGDDVTEKWFVNDATNFLFCKATGKYKPTLPENRSERSIKQHCSLVTRISKQLGYNSLKHVGRFKGGYGPLSFIVSESGPNHIKNIVNSSSHDDDKLYEVESASERCLIGAPVDTGSIYLSIIEELFHL